MFISQVYSACSKDVSLITVCPNGPVQIYLLITFRLEGWFEVNPVKSLKSNVKCLGVTTQEENAKSN